MESVEINENERIRQQVFERARQIRSGQVISYGALGARCEPPISGYICGRILGKVDDDVPWWRVVGKNGALPIRKRHPELETRQRALLEAEGVEFDGEGTVETRFFAE